MYISNDARKMVILYNSRQETKISGTSLYVRDFRLRPNTYRDSNLFEVEYWVTSKEADNRFNLLTTWLNFTILCF